MVILPTGVLNRGHARTPHHSTRVPVNYKQNHTQNVLSMRQLPASAGQRVLTIATLAIKCPNTTGIYIVLSVDERSGIP